MSQFDHPANERLKALRVLEGPALIEALIGEIESLHGDLSAVTREVEVLRRYQVARQRRIQEQSPAGVATPMPLSISIDAADLLYPEQGFYPLERNEAGATFRWTGPSPFFTFTVFVDRSAGAELKLEVLSLIDYERQKDIRLWVNGESVPSTISPSHEGVVLATQLPAAHDNEPVFLEFAVPEVINPGGGEKRSLGVAFRALSITSRKAPGLGNEQGDAKGSDVVKFPRGPRVASSRKATDAAST